jgi:type IV pilus assembly protein PilB
MPSDNQKFRHDHMQAELIEVNAIMQEHAVIQKARELGIPYIDVAKIPIDLSVINLIDKTTAQNALVLPFFLVGERVKLAIVDPDRKEATEVIKFLEEKGYKVQMNLCSKDGLIGALEHYDKVTIQENPDLDQEFEKSIEEGYDMEIKGLLALQQKLKDASSQDIFNLIVVGALKSKASDIHMEPYEEYVMLRYRIDGNMMDVFMMTHSIYNQVVSQIKYQAKLKLNIKNIPQDGRIEFHLKGRGVDLRVSTLPTEYGENIVMRLLDSENKSLFLNFEALGIRDEIKDRLISIISKPYGVLVITGPTGSGKTTTLYSILHRLNKPEVNIITLEDPVEYRLKGVNQTQIRDDIGLTFAAAMRSVLRQDPDIIMVGEIRDIEVGNTAMQASLTGHFVLTTLHTNDAISSIPRLVNMGIGAYMVAPALTGLMAQRLVRRPCSVCSKKINLDPVTDASSIAYINKHLDIYNQRTGKNISFTGEVVKIIGCEVCSGTGYRGRVALYEILEIDNHLREMIVQGAMQSDLEKYAFTQGFFNMAEDGVLKIIRGETTVEEVRRVVG